MWDFCFPLQRQSHKINMICKINKLYVCINMLYVCVIWYKSKQAFTRWLDKCILIPYKYLDMH